MTKEKASVIIIGAGMAGISAANHLKKSGIKNLLILEGGNRIGGRILTDTTNGNTIEMGASWIHGAEDKNPIIQIAKKAKTQSSCLSMEKYLLYNEVGKTYPISQLKKSAKAFHKLLKAIEKKGKRKKTVIQLINQISPKSLKDPLIQYLLSANLEFDLGGDINRLSSKYFYDDKEFPGPDLYITDGYQKIINQLGKKLPYKLNERVKAIDYRKSSIVVHTNQKKYKADRVILSVPLGILKKGSIQFLPELPSKKLRSIHRVGFGTVNKVVLLFDKIFWDKKIEHFGIAPSPKGQYNYFMNLHAINGVKGLMTFAFGSFAKKMEQHSDKQVKINVLQQLQKIYGKKVVNPIAILRTQWHSDPLFGGAYSFAAVDSIPKDFEQLAKDINQQIFFAGEHTSHDYRGTVHGAYISGIRAANEVLNSIKLLA